MRKLTIIDDLTEIVSEKSTRVPLPTKAETLYVEPLPGNKGRKCGNCALWIRDNVVCQVHDPTLHITENMICGLWVGGEPLQKSVLKEVDYVEPKLSGLIRGPEAGTKCENCRYSQDQNCLAMEENGKHPPISPGGCCNRWTSLD